MISRKTVQRALQSFSGVPRKTLVDDFPNTAADLLRELTRNGATTKDVIRNHAASLSNRLRNSADGDATTQQYESCAIGLTAWSDRQLAQCLAAAKARQANAVFLDVLILYQSSLLATRSDHVRALAARHVDGLSVHQTPKIAKRRECVLMGSHGFVENVSQFRGGLYSCSYLLGLLRDPTRWSVDDSVEIYRRVTLLSPEWGGPRTAIDVAGGLDIGDANRGSLGLKYRVRLVPYVLSSSWDDKDIDALSTLLDDQDGEWA